MELGFPSFFEVFRSAPQGALTTLGRVSFPTTADAAWTRIDEDFATRPPLAQRYRDAARQMVNLHSDSLRAARADGAFDQVIVPPRSSADRARLRLCDLLQLAALDPYLARIQGLYWIDLPPSAGATYEYFVEAEYGARAYPSRRIDLRTIEAGLVQRGELGDGIGFSVRPTAVTEDDEFIGRHVIASGETHLPLVLVFPQPVLEVSLELRADVAGEWRVMVDGATATATLADGWLKVVGTAAFSRAWIVGPSGNWHLFSLDTRRENGAIGRIKSDRVTVRFDAPPAATRVPAPPVTKLLARPVAPTLDRDSGEIVQGTSEVVLDSVVCAPPDWPHRPVRLMARRRAQGSTTPQIVSIDDQGQASPVLVQDAGDVALPPLVSWLPLDGHTRDLKTGVEATSSASIEFTAGPPDEGRGRALLLDGDHRIVLDWPVGVNLSRAFTFTIAVKPRPRGAEAVVAEISGSGNLALRLRRTPAARWRPALAIATAAGAPVVYDAARDLRADDWARLTVVYDGRDLRFFIDGEEDAIHGTSAIAGLPAAARKLTLAHGTAGSESALEPFQGALAHASIWQRALHPDEVRDRLAREGHALAGVTASHAAVAHWRALQRFDAANPFVTAIDRPELQAFGQRLTLELWVRVDPTSTVSTPTLVGNDWTRSFWLGLRKDADGYTPRLWLNKPPDVTANLFHGTRKLQAGVWHHLVVSYDGAAVRFFLDGVADAVVLAALGAVRANPGGVLLLGADARSTRDAVLLPFRGELAGVRIWRDALSAEDVLRKTGRTQIVDRPVVQGTHLYELQGVDLFGRTGPWSATASVSTRDELVLEPPLDLHVMLEPPVGRLTAVDGNLLRIDAPLIEQGLGDGTLQAETAFSSITAEVSRAQPDGRRQRQVLEIATFEFDTLAPAGRRLVARVALPPLARLAPAVGDKIQLHHYVRLRARWAWTGLQQVFNPDVSEHRLLLRPGSPFDLRGVAKSISGAETAVFNVATDIRFTGAAGALSGARCDIGGSLYVIRSHTTGNRISLTVEYRARPIEVPRHGSGITISLPGRAAIRGALADAATWPVTRLVQPVQPPAPARQVSVVPAQARRLTGTQADALAGAGVGWLRRQATYRIDVGRLAPEPTQLPPDGWVPGALVAGDETIKQGWGVWRVEWAEREASGWVLYFAVDEGEASPLPETIVLTSLRYYAGRCYQVELSQDSVFAAGEATITWTCGLVSAGARGTGRVGTTATAVAVNRRLPPESPVPIIDSITAADVHGNSYATVRWNDDGHEGERVRYHLYRSVDSLVFARDLEQRRERTGAYEGISPAEVFADDTDFDAWLRSQGDGTLGVGAVFEGGEPADGVWRAWAARFYSALLPAEVSSLAARAGNERAFNVVTERPIDHGSFRDQIPGRVRNAYLYRVQTMSAALATRKVPGPCSLPRRAPPVTPPPAPVLTRVDPGDCAATLTWSLVSHPEIDHYRLYRAETAAELDDLRWFGGGDDPRVVAIRPDPRWLTDRDEDGAPILRVGTDPATAPAAIHGPGDPRRVFDLLIGFDAATGIARLRRIGPGTPVVLTVRAAGGTEQRIDRRLTVPPYTDAGLLGRHDYHYCVVAVDRYGNVSKPSPVKRVRTLEIAPPEVPAFTMRRVAVATGEHDVLLRCEAAPRGLEVLLRRRSYGDRFPRIVHNWHSLLEGHELRDRVESDRLARYEVLVRTINQTVCEVPAVLNSLPSSVEP